MKTPLFHLHEKIGPGLALIALLAATPLNAQTSPPPGTQTTEGSASQKLSPADLNDLLGPIALYPDALVALILPASTVPSDITIAARYLNQNGSDANIDDQPWDPSVKALARYPDVLTWMDENLEWTNSLGEAFVEQPADVMNAMQVLRVEAKDKGNLVNTPQQTVVVEKQTQEIRIVPTEPDVIYVPQYDPEVVYVQEYQPDYGPVLAFGAGFAVGAWLSYDCDWGGRGIYYGNDCGWNNHNRWNDRGWNDRNYDNGSVNIVNNNTNITNNNFNNNNGSNNAAARRWQASSNSQRQFNQRRNQNLGNARIARANAQVRHPNSQTVNGHAAKVASTRPAQVPKPARLNAAQRNNGGKHPNAAVRAPGAANANAGKGPNNKAPNASVKHPNAANNNKPGNPNHRPKPSAPPSVAGQSGKNPGGNKHPNKSPNASTRNPNQNPGKPKNKPSAAPSNQGGSNKPKNATGNTNKPRQQHSQPSAAPQNRPKVQHSQAPQAKPRPQQQQQQHKPQQAQRQQVHQQQSRPQQSRPQQSKPQRQPQVHQQASNPRPQAHAAGSGQKQGSGNKKKKDNNN